MRKHLLLGLVVPGAAPGKGRPCLAAAPAQGEVDAGAAWEGLCQRHTSHHRCCTAAYHSLERMWEASSSHSSSTGGSLESAEGAPLQPMTAGRLPRSWSQLARELRGEQAGRPG